MFSSSRLKAPGKTLNKNPTLTIATSDLLTTKTPKNVSSQKKDTPSKTTTQSESSEPTRSDKMTKPTRNFSWKSLPASKNPMPLNSKEIFWYFYLIIQTEFTRFGELREKIRIETLNAQSSKAIITFTSIESGENALKNFNLNLKVQPERTFVLRPFASK